MSTTVRDLVDEEEADLKEEDEDEGEDEEDDDYVPNEADYDEDEDDEDAYDNDVAEVVTETGQKRAAPAKATKAAKAKRSKVDATGTTAKAARRQSNPSKKASKGGGITLDDDDDEAALPDEGNASGRGAARTASLNAPSGAGPPVSTEPEKPSVDALWAELQGHASAPAAPARTPSATTSAADTGSGGGGGLDIKALLAKTGGATSSTPAAGSSAGKKMVEIRTKMDFCGEEIVVTKRVQLGSAEEVAHRQRTDGQSDAEPAKTAPAAASKMSLVASALATSAELRNQMHATPAAPPAGRGASSAGGLRTDASLEFKPALPPPKLPGVVANKPTGLQGLLASIDGKKKMSTMEKSRHDWGNFKDKQDDHTRDGMERFAKDGYLAKQAFLARTDVRQAEVARGNRRRGMGLKD